MKPNTPIDSAATTTRHALRVRELDSAAALEPFLDDLCQDRDPIWAAHIVRRAASVETCSRIAQNFRSLIAQHGTQRRPDGYVTVDQVGATQFRKSAAEYIEQCARAQAGVAALFRDVASGEQDTPLLTGWLTAALAARGYDLGPALFAGGQAGLCVARSWRNTGAFALEPHEDAAQLADVAEDGFEIATVRRVFASIACIEPGDGGDLILWDLVPDDRLRAALGVMRTGYPYPAALLAEIPAVRVSLAQGDVAIIDASRIHAVEAVRDGMRISMGRFLGRTSDRRIVWWT